MDQPALTNPVRRVGFTLIELLVVISIIALLAAVLLPALQTARSTAQRTICQSQLRQLAGAFHMYTDDASGRIPWSWDANRGTTRLTTPYPTYFAVSYTVSGTRLPWSSNDGVYWYYSYLKSAGLFCCPVLVQGAADCTPYGAVAEVAPRPFYVDIPAISCSALVYPHYRQNPYFGHYGGMAGNISEFPTVDASFLNTYRIKATLSTVTGPSDTILHFDTSPVLAGTIHRYSATYVPSPATANTKYLGGGLDRAKPASYGANFAYTPNIGFVHGGRSRYLGMFSYVDGHVDAQSAATILSDTNDTKFRLLK